MDPNIEHRTSNAQHRMEEGEEKKPAMDRCPNPRCEHTAVPKVWDISGVTFAVDCKACGMTGPMEDSEREAIEAWNRLPRPEVSSVMISVFCGCKRVVDMKDWRGVQGVSHSLCPSCAKRLYGIDLAEQKQHVEHRTPNVQHRMEENPVRTGRDRSSLQEVAS